MRIRITHAGPGNRTQITHAETDEEVSWVKWIDLHLDPDNEQQPTATLAFYAPYLDLIMESEMIQVCPHCDHDLSAMRTLMQQRHQGKEEKE